MNLRGGVGFLSSKSFFFKHLRVYVASFYLAVTSVSVSVLLWAVSSGGTVIFDYWTCKSRSHFGHTQLDLPSLAYNIPYRHFLIPYHVNIVHRLAKWIQNLFTLQDSMLVAL